MALVILRLHPVEPVAAADFTDYLDGLTIKAFDLGVGSPGGIPAGEAGYVTPANPAQPWVPDPNTRIVQHFEEIPPPIGSGDPPIRNMLSVATAVIDVVLPAGHPEHDKFDVRLEITRGAGTLVHRQVYPNVPVSTSALPASTAFPTLMPTSLFLALPDPGRDVDPADAVVELPIDGTPPRFDDLKGAVDIVLGHDPGAGNAPQLADLTPQQARHIAFEIVWNQKFRPRPDQTPLKLEQMYTAPDSGDDEKDRGKFEAALRAYYATTDAEAERLAGFVSALAAAVNAEARSAAAERTGFLLPVLPGATGTGPRFKSVRVILTAPGAPLATPFTVPAVYFYALGATMPTQVVAEQRYRMATLQEEENLSAALHNAVDAGVIIEDNGVNIAQAARRLRSLGAVGGVAPEFALNGGSAEQVAVQALIQAWLTFTGTDIFDFWGGALTAAERAGHLELVLRALTDSHPALIIAIKTVTATWPAVTSAEDIDDRPAGDWRGLFGTPPNAALLPPFTEPGSAEDRVEAFIRHVQKFFAVDTAVGDPADPTLDGPPRFRLLTDDPLTRFTLAYRARAGAEFQFGAGWNRDDADDAVVDVFPDDGQAQVWLAEAIDAIEDLLGLARAAGIDATLAFSIMEALYARGFTRSAQVAALSRADFRESLTGTVAYAHADAIYDEADEAGPGHEPGDEGFRPVNPDGCLVNCIPPLYLSPLGPVAYLHELLLLTRESTCDEPTSDDDEVQPFGDVITARRGPLGGLLASRANLETPLPLIDLVNECLEAVAADPANPAGAVHDTGADMLGGHALADHDPATLFEALPEHSTPATPVAEAGAYAALRADFSSPQLPYAQPVDISHSYLGHLRTSRFDVLRRFRKDITEFVLDPENDPAGFEPHLWRYPVRIDVAREYLGVTREEYELLYTTDIADVPVVGQLLLRELYGFPADAMGGEDWTDVVVRLPEFLARTGLTYCEFLELWAAEFVVFTRVGDDKGFPDCEPCFLDEYRLEIPLDGLRRLAVFIRLWRTLRSLPGGGHSFAELRDICVVLRLFDGGGAINPDFIRQLAALRILMGRFGIVLLDEHDLPVAGATGADRTHLLALWDGPAAAKWEWAVDQLLDQVQQYAMDRYACECRTAEFRKVLEINLDGLSELAGFTPAPPPDHTWHAHPTHTLRFAETLAKIYASEFGVGEVLYLFSDDGHLRGDDPFPLQPGNEALDSPLELPDDERPFSLWDLRTKLLAVGEDLTDEDAGHWTWDRIEQAVRERFGFAPPGGGPDPLMILGEHFFPSVLQAEGHPVPADRRQWRAGLAPTVPPMWNTPPGPFNYDVATQELYVELPLTDEAVIAKLSRVRQLDAAEQAAVRELYFLPRADLAPFAFMFGSFSEAEDRLIQEPDEAVRWAWFQHEFARCYRRSEVIATHLAGHVVEWTHRAGEEDPELAWTLLISLFADENRAAADWENDGGQTPAVTWPNHPSGGAFAALLGLVGTGLLGELSPHGTGLGWRETRGPMNAFGAEENAANTPIPTVLPDLGLALTPAQQDFVWTINGFLFANRDDTLLGGGQGFTARWTGVLLVEESGQYEFRAGAPTGEGDAPDFEQADDKKWRVTLAQGQRTWVVLSHRWDDETAPPDCAAPLYLRRGGCELTVELVQPRPEYGRQEDVCPLTSGFEIKYAGPDTADELLAIPHNRLYRDRKSQPLGAGVGGLQGAADRFLRDRYSSTLRDVRRTYQRAFKALLFAQRLGLSAQPAADDGQSEIGYLLTHPDNFAGTSYYTAAGGFTAHRAFLDFNLLPVNDNYHSPAAAEDRRAEPSPQRQQAMFDWWERAFDYVTLRRNAAQAPEPPVWLLFHEAAEGHPDLPAQLRRHMGVRRLHVPLVLRYFDGYDVTSADLEDERWAVRVWHASRWLQELEAAFLVDDIRRARPDLWVSDDLDLLVADVPVPGTDQSANQNLTGFVRDGCIENGEPQRYEDVKRLNDGLRLRGRAALLAYLCGMERVALPWGGSATTPRDLSELLLLDVEAGLCQRATRVEEAITVVHAFVARSRLGLEPGLVVPAALALLWDRRFATYRTWEACTRRTLYRENWIDWEELERARRREAFRFLEAELRRAALTVPVPGGLVYWPDQRPPSHPGLTVLQAREPAQIQPIDPTHHGFDLLGTPERQARPSWLAALGLPLGNGGNGNGDDGGNGDGNGNGNGNDVVLRLTGVDSVAASHLPLWIQAAIRVGARFIRIAAAAEPPASAELRPQRPEEDPACCEECEGAHSAVVDEYYFWLVDSRSYEAPPKVRQGNDPLAAEPQNASWNWHDGEMLPKLLHWDAEPTVHLAWCRVHNGEFTQPRRSHEAVRVETSGPELTFMGRSDDSLRFEVAGGRRPKGHGDPTAPGFRYDLVTDVAVTLPLIAALPAPQPPPPPPPFAYPGDLDAYPYFAYFAPGAPVLPSSPFAPAVAVAGNLRTHCQFEAALKWYELAFAPLSSDSTWLRCQDDSDGDGDGNGDGDGDGGPVVVVRRRDSSPCCQDATVATDEDLRQRSIILHCLETLLEWGDALMRRNTPEAFQQARTIYDTMAKLLGLLPSTVIAADPPGAPVPISGFVAHHAPLNPRLQTLYQQSTDRQALIHTCLNARRLRTGRRPYWDDSTARGGWQPTTQVCLDDLDWCDPGSCYRFAFLVQKAQELANEVRGLGASLLAAYEKGDAEYLASLRATHERQLLNLALEIRQNQWREADWQVQALQKTKELAQTRHRYYTLLIQNGLNNREDEHVSLINTSIELRAAGNISEGIAQIMNAIPDFFVGFPCTFTWTPLGTKLSGVFTAIARIANSLAEISTATGGLRLTEAGWERREEEWRHQVEVLAIELEQIERQILAADRRQDIALRELNNHQVQLEQSGEVHDFLRDKFTTHDLYLFLQQETAALHAQMYELALHAARQAQRAFNYERGHTACTFVTDDAWDHLREGLQAGDRLQLGLRQMEQAYLDANCREYELTKHISLRLHFPMEFLALQATGACEIELPEWMFDLDYPGHYMRRIKNVSLTIPCVVGPYSGVHCRLTLLTSTTRVDPRLADPPHACCPDGLTGNGYQALPDDPRIVRHYAATEAIATSSGQNDSGMFELSFRDERYLPFEFAGAVSRWRIELPRENNQFDIDTVADVVLHLNYAAREGGDNLREVANDIAQRYLSGEGLRYFDLKHDLPDAWHLFRHPAESTDAPREFALRLHRGMFAFLPGMRDLRITQFALFMEADGAVPSAHHVVTFEESPVRGGDAQWEPCHPREMNCVASVEWPGLFQGVLKLDGNPQLVGHAERELGVFTIPADIGRISRAVLFCRYELVGRSE